MTRGRLGIPSDSETGLMALGQSASSAARAILIATHKIEYDRLVLQERRKRGLPDKTGAQVLAEHHGRDAPKSQAQRDLEAAESFIAVAISEDGQVCVGPFPSLSGAQHWLEWKEDISRWKSESHVFKLVRPDQWFDKEMAE